MFCCPGKVKGKETSSFHVYAQVTFPSTFTSIFPREPYPNDQNQSGIMVLVVQLKSRIQKD